MYQFDYSFRVRYAETDQMGYVYHANYAVFYEVARTEMLRSVGLSYRDMEEQNVVMPVVALRIDYLEPALYDDLLIVRVSVKKMPAARIEFFYEVFREDGRLLNSGSTTLAFLNKLTRRPRRVPAHLEHFFRPFFGE